MKTETRVVAPTPSQQEFIKLLEESLTTRRTYDTTLHQMGVVPALERLHAINAGRFDGAVNAR